MSAGSWTAVWSFATPTDDVTGLELEYGNDGVKIRVFMVDQFLYLDAQDEDERVLTPSAVQGEKVPPIEEPPDPFSDGPSET